MSRAFCAAVGVGEAGADTVVEDEVAADMDINPTAELAGGALAARRLFS